MDVIAQAGRTGRRQFCSSKILEWAWTGLEGNGNGYTGHNLVGLGDSSGSAHLGDHAGCSKRSAI